MVRHISIFFLKEENREEHKKRLLARLADMETQLSDIEHYKAGEDCMERPPKGIPGVPEFGDVVQVIDFKKESDAISYPEHPAHLALVKEMENALEKVVAIDIRL